MGIVKEELADFELSDGTQFTMELNESGSIHIHIDNIRYDMVPEEFDHFADVIEQAQHELYEVKHG